MPWKSFSDRVFQLLGLVSNIGAALVGGPGIVPGANIGRVSLVVGSVDLPIRRCILTLALLIRNTPFSNLDVVTSVKTLWDRTKPTLPLSFFPPP